MRYSAVHIEDSVYSAAPTHVTPNTYIYASVNAIAYKRKAGFKIVSERDALIHMKKGKQDIVMIAETSPVFNAYLFYNITFHQLSRYYDAMQVVSNECKKVISAK